MPRRPESRATASHCDAYPRSGSAPATEMRTGGVWRHAICEMRKGQFDCSPLMACSARPPHGAEAPPTAPGSFTTVAPARRPNPPLSRALMRMSGSVVHRTNAKTKNSRPKPGQPQHHEKPRSQPTPATRPPQTPLCHKFGNCPRGQTPGLFVLPPKKFASRNDSSRPPRSKGQARLHIKCMTRNPQENCNRQVLVFDDLPNCSAVLAPLAPTMDQCAIHVGSVQQAILFLLRDSLAGMVEVHFHGEPDDATYIAMGRAIRAHQRVCREGGEFL